MLGHTDVMSVRLRVMPKYDEHNAGNIWYVVAILERNVATLLGTLSILEQDIPARRMSKLW